MPTNNPAAALADQALYGDAPLVPFLGCWLGTDVDDGEAFMMARPYLLEAEHHKFDLNREPGWEIVQRTFMLLVALSEGAAL
jgi:hypothetical protein